MPDAVEQPGPEMPDQQRRKILTTLVTAVAVAVPAARVLLGKKADYGGAGS